MLDQVVAAGTGADDRRKSAGAARAARPPVVLRGGSAVPTVAELAGCYTLSVGAWPPGATGERPTRLTLGSAFAPRSGTVDGARARVATVSGGTYPRARWVVIGGVVHVDLDPGPPRVRLTMRPDSSGALRGTMALAGEGVRYETSSVEARRGCAAR